MKAIKVVEPFKVEIVDVPKPTIQNPDDVIVRITSGGICGSESVFTTEPTLLPLIHVSLVMNLAVLLLKLEKM